MSSPPETTRVLVIGGGPAGSTAATLLAREGYEVTLLEQSHFPRYHIGESLLPSLLEIIDLLGAREKVEAYGFTHKTGAFLEWGSEKWALNFGELSGNHTYSFQVIRSEFDQLMLEHAKSQGAKVFEGVEVTAISFEGDRPCRATWVKKAGENGNGSAKIQGEISFEYLVDGSGRTSLMANKYLRNRRYHRIFQNVAIWGYWKNAKRLGNGRDGDIAVSSIPNGWLWAIPLHDDTMSVGVVMHKDTVTEKKPVMLEEIYQKAIQDSRLMTDIVQPGELVSEVYSEQDYSYANESFCGPGYFMAGDAACFLDPLLSSGVHLAMFSAMLAAASIGSIFRGEVTEGEAGSFYEKSYRQAYLRFLVFLSAFYDVNRGKDAYFWEAQRLTREELDQINLKQAFLNLVTGLKDLADAQSDTDHLILEEMTKRIDQNLQFRRDKKVLAGLEGEKREAADANARFFSSVEGLFSLEKTEAIDGLYVSSQPRLRLARVQTAE